MPKWYSFLVFAESENFLRKVRDSNPRYDVMRTPHFECGSFDHSDNFPNALSSRFGQKRRKSRANFGYGKKRCEFLQIFLSGGKVGVLLRLQMVLETPVRRVE